PRSCRTCRSWSIRVTARASVSSSRPWPWRRSPPAQTASCSKPTRTPTTPSPTAPSRSIFPAWIAYWNRSNAWPNRWERRLPERYLPHSHGHGQLAAFAHGSDHGLLGGIDDAAEDLDVQPGGGARGRLPLHAEGEPARVSAFDSFDDAVEGIGADAEFLGETTYALAMFAVDDDFPFAEELGHQRVRMKQNGMADARFRRVAMLQGFGTFLGQVLEVGAAKSGVHGKQALVDGEQGKTMALAPQAERFPVAHLADGVGAMAAQDDALQAVQDLGPGITAGVGFEKQGRGTGGRHRAVISRRPQADAAALRGDFRPVDADANRGIGGEHGRTPFPLRSKRNCASSPSSAPQRMVFSNDRFGRDRNIIISRAADASKKWKNFRIVK